MEHESSTPTAPTRGVSRRGFLGRAGSLAAATVATGALGALPLGDASSVRADREDGVPISGPKRAERAYDIRVDAAKQERQQPLPDHPTNGDEGRYATHFANFSKALPHNQFGEVDPAAYSALLSALTSGNPADFEAIPLGGGVKLADPQAAYAYVLEGADSGALASAPPPAFASAQMAAEMAEMYWYALARDVPFATFASDPVIAQAAADLSRLPDFPGPRDGGAVTPATIFRQGLAGETIGPWLSQFLWLPVPTGALTVQQQYNVAPAKEYLTTYADWLTCQNGGFRAGPPPPPPPPRYMIVGRDLATYLKIDYNYQAYLNAALILDRMGAPLDAANPYVTSKTQVGVATFGRHGLVDLVARVANAAVKACWYQKWLVHRSIRPEEFGGRVHNHKTGAASYPIHNELLSTSSVLDAVFAKHGTYLLPMAYPDGCPVHPSYPAGHPVVTGACVTALKAWFDESYVLPAPVVATSAGSALVPYTGAALTVGGELNKLAGNLAVGRSFGGVHWRSDNSEGLRLGEAVALAVMGEEHSGYNQPFSGFSVTTFDGTTVSA